MTRVSSVSTGNNPGPERFRLSSEERDALIGRQAVRIKAYGNAYKATHIRYPELFRPVTTPEPRDIANAVMNIADTAAPVVTAPVEQPQAPAAEIAMDDPVTAARRKVEASYA